MLTLCGATHAVAVEARVDEPARREFFETKIRPILAAHCQSCHGPQTQGGGLRVDWREPLVKGGDSGPALESGRPEESLLLRVIEHHEPGLEMPKKASKLPQHVVQDFRTWIQNGAFDPRDKPATADESAQIEWQAKLNERRKWWSLQPARSYVSPTTKDTGWANGTVDIWILSRLESSKLSPSPVADRATLARRLSFVLTGLPLSPDLLKTFLDDPATDRIAYETLVDRLLASPHFGERWARHWMDVVRYGDTYGYEWDMPAKGAWRYRDYLIRAFNNDVPFDQLVREQIAGDLLPNPRINDRDRINESLIGPMFYQLGEKRHGDSAEFDGIHQEMLHNKIDALSKAFQGITVGCARCHDHKLDAVSQRDYYAVAGSLISPRWVTRTIDTLERNREALAGLRKRKDPLRRALSAVWLETASHWPESWANPKPPENWRKSVTAAGDAPGWEHPLRAWVELEKVASRSGDVRAEWARLAKGYGDERAARVKHNTERFRVVADFSKSVPAGWSTDGVGLQDGPVHPGDFVVSLEGSTAIGMILPGGLFTHALSPRLNGAIRTPRLKTFAHPWLSLETCGGDFSAERTVVDNAFLTERQTYLARRDPAWSSYPPFPELSGRNVYREVATKTSNPNFPPRVGLGGACSDAQIADPKSWFGITRAVISQTEGAPRDELARFRSLFDGTPPRTMREVAIRYASWWRSSLERWERDKATDDDATQINWLIDQNLLTNRSDDAGWPTVRDLVADYRRAERLVLEPQTVNGMAEIDDGIDYRLNIRGEYDQLGPAIPRGYLGVLEQNDVAARFKSPKSGRLELADRIASAKNPLTARVYVNRIWQWIFGAGIVTTPDDFGRLGSPPSHPELLDVLARDFVEHQWSTKQLVRRLVTSETFKQANGSTSHATDRDPGNALLHHFALRRLEAEEIRDAILAASGRLDRSLYGPAIDPHRSKEDPPKRLVSGPVDGLGRRSLYTKVTIMEPPRFLATFNQPPPKIPSGRRDVTSNPSQALTLLNDPFVIGQAQYWGQRVATMPRRSPEEKLSAMFLAALSREPSGEELARWGVLLEQLATERKVTVARMNENPLVWADVAHVIFNIKEFIYYR